MKIQKVLFRCFMMTIFGLSLSFNLFTKDDDKKSKKRTGTSSKNVMLKNGLSIPITQKCVKTNKSHNIGAGNVDKISPSENPSTHTITATGYATITSPALYYGDSWIVNSTPGVNGTPGILTMTKSTTPLTEGTPVPFTNNLSVGVTVTASAKGKIYQTITIPAMVVGGTVPSASILCNSNTTTPITLSVVGAAPYTTAVTATYSPSVPTFTITAGPPGPLSTILLNAPAQTTSAPSAAASAKTKYAAKVANK